LKIASKYGQVEIVKYILSLKSQFPKIDLLFHSNISLGIAIKNNRTELVKFLLSLKPQYPEMFITRQLFENGIYVSERKTLLKRTKKKMGIIC